MVNLKEVARKLSEREDTLMKKVGEKAKEIDLERKIKSKTVLRSGRMTTTIKDYKAPCLLKDKQRFFKGNVEDFLLE
jgi:hypothetical protein